MTTINNDGACLALTIWREQISIGIGDETENPNMTDIWDWIYNRSYPPNILEAAAAGNVAALVEVRSEAGVPVFS